ncbi:MAG: hypothetical protein ACOC0D_04370 [Spirochaeta sp.]
MIPAHKIPVVMCIAAAVLLASCATDVEVQRPVQQRGWDDSVRAALEDAHQNLQQTRDLPLRARQALWIAETYLAMNAVAEAEHYTLIARNIIQESEEPLYPQTLHLIRLSYALERIDIAEQFLQSMLDSLTLSGDESLQGDYLIQLLDLVFSLEDPDADVFRRITDRVLFIGDPAIRSEVLRITIRHIWQESFEGDVTGIVQHAIAATAGIEDQVAQAAGFVHLSGLTGALGRPVTGVDPGQLMRRGMSIWRGADLWSIDRDTAAIAVRGSMLGRSTGILDEILLGIPGNNARVEILTEQAYWFSRFQLDDIAAEILDYADRHAEETDSGELEAAGLAKIALGRYLAGDSQQAGQLLPAAEAAADRYWHTDANAAYAAARIYAETGQVNRIAEVAGDQRDPLDQVRVYLRLYNELSPEALQQGSSLILREVPFLLRRIGWSRSNQLPELVQQAVIRAAERGDTAFIAELRAIRPPQELEVFIDARYAHALLVRLQL